MTTHNFKDHFSSQSSDYQKFRPVYPDSLYQFLSTMAPTRQLAWDCATGNGQAAIGLSNYFQHIIATDASRNQLQHAMAAANIEYLQAPAEHTPLRDQSVDLLVVAQALHWFNHAAFYREARRVLKDQGIIAVWSYQLFSVSPEINQIIHYLYHDILNSYWPEERRLLENAYRDIEFPFQPVACPEFRMQMQWNLQQLTGYLHTWSAVQRYISARGSNPLHDINEKLNSAWGPAADTKNIIWPLQLMLGRQPIEID